MFVCKCWFDLHILSEPNSLKAKRQVLNRIKDRVWNKFRVSIAEVGSNDLWQRAELGIAFVTTDPAIADSMITKIIGQIESEGDVEVTDKFIETEKMK